MDKLNTCYKYLSENANLDNLEKFFLNDANRGEFINNCCNNPYNTFHRYCQEWYLYNLMKNNTVKCES